jgi:hypothetical protein
MSSFKERTGLGGLLDKAAAALFGPKQQAAQQQAAQQQAAQQQRQQAAQSSSSSSSSAPAAEAGELAKPQRLRQQVPLQEAEQPQPQQQADSRAVASVDISRLEADKITVQELKSRWAGGACFGALGYPTLRNVPSCFVQGFGPGAGPPAEAQGPAATPRPAQPCQCQQREGAQPGAPAFAAG